MYDKGIISIDKETAKDNEQNELEQTINLNG